jgi:hypothetical protein
VFFGYDAEWCQKIIQRFQTMWRSSPEDDTTMSDDVEVAVGVILLGIKSISIRHQLAIISFDDDKLWSSHDPLLNKLTD